MHYLLHTESPLLLGLLCSRSISSSSKKVFEKSLDKSSIFLCSLDDDFRISLPLALVLDGWAPCTLAQKKGYELEQNLAVLQNLSTQKETSLYLWRARSRLWSIIWLFFRVISACCTLWGISVIVSNFFLRVWPFRCRNPLSPLVSPAYLLTL